MRHKIVQIIFFLYIDTFKRPLLKERRQPAKEIDPHTNLAPKPLGHAISHKFGRFCHAILFFLHSLHRRYNKKCLHID